MGEQRVNPRKPPPVAVRPSPSDPRQGVIRFGAVTLRCALGKGGISAFKREGDGAAPLGRMSILGGYLRRDKRFAAPNRLDLRAIRATDGWCDAASDRNYNRPVRLPYATSAETMRRNDSLYDICLILDWNIRPRRRGAGSAIFFHLARPGYLPTEGCIAVSRRDMARLLPFLTKRSAVIVRR